MIKKVLLFKHADICFDSLNAFSDYVAEQLNSYDIKYDYIDVTKPSEIIIQDMYNKLNDSFDVALAFNAPGQHNVMYNNENIFDKYNIPFYNWIVDHPITNMHYLESSCKNYNLICMDRNHVKYVKEKCPSVRNAFFIPLGGVSPEEPSIPLDERMFDVSFPGGFPGKVLNEMFNSYKDYPEPNRELILNLIDYSIENTKLDITEVLEIILQKVFGTTDLKDEDYTKALKIALRANNFMRLYFRTEVLQQLINSDLKLHIFGYSDENRIGSGSGKTVFHGAIPYNKSGYIFRNSKIILNIMPCFKNGSHDRIASGMLHGNVVLTDHSRYLDELPDNILRFYDISKSEELPGIIENLMQEPKTMQELSINGQEYAIKHFSWKKSVDSFLQIANQ